MVYLRWNQVVVFTCTADIPIVTAVPAIIAVTAVHAKHIFQPQLFEWNNQISIIINKSHSLQSQIVNMYFGEGYIAIYCFLAARYPVNWNHPTLLV